MPERPRPSVLITGASRGIGRAIALRLAREYDVVAAARSERALEELAAEIGEGGGRCATVTLDVANPRAVAEALAGVEVDALVNDAGVMTQKRFLDLAPEEWHAMVDVNLNALYHVTRAVLPGMVARGRGHVVTIGSTAGRGAFVGGTAYAATKHAVMGFSESLLFEVRDSGVKVSVVMPGSVATGIHPDGQDTSWMMRPEDVAESVAHVLATPPGVLVYQLEVRPLALKR
ncbi:MAG: SDR family oxidoreductase [Gemmatimonadaceae bacterium]